MQSTNAHHQANTGATTGNNGLETIKIVEVRRGEFGVGRTHIVLGVKCGSPIAGDMKHYVGFYRLNSARLNVMMRVCRCWQRSGRKPRRGRGESSVMDSGRQEG
jgi:hypothetical protein